MATGTRGSRASGADSLSGGHPIVNSSERTESRVRSLAHLVVFAILVGSAIFLLERFFPGFSDTTVAVTPSFAIVREGLLLAAVGVPTILMALVEGRNPLSYGLIGSGSLRNFSSGLVWGVTFVSLLVVALAVSAHLIFNGRLLSGGSAIAYGLAWAGCFFAVGLTEEMLFRGYLQFTLARLIGFWPAAALLSLLFGLVHLHNSHEVMFGIVIVALGGAFFSLGLRRTGSLWWGIGFHTAWDWSQSFLYGTPDSGILIADRLFQTRSAGEAILSGGDAGPEGSVLVIPIMGIALVAMLRFVRREPAGLNPVSNGSAQRGR